MTDKAELTPEQKDELVAFFQNNDFTADTRQGVAIGYIAKPTEKSA